MVKRIKKGINVKEKTKNKNSFTTSEVIFLVIVTCIVSLLMGFIISKNNQKKSYGVKDKNLQEFIENYNYVIDNYYEKIDTKKLLDNAFSGMLSSLDDGYSYLIEEDESNTFNIQLNGKYNGIGVEVVTIENGDTLIYRVFDGTPAKKAGLKEGDIIKEIDDKSFSGKQASDIADYIKNETKDKFKIKIVRDKKEKIIEVNKGNVTIKSINSEIYKKNDKKIGYIYIEIFSTVAYQQFKEELEKLEKEDIDSLIIDVRDNTGGHLTTAVKIMSLFLDSKHVIYQTETKTKKEKFYSVGKETKKYPIVVIQNKNSASASEMLSATLKEEYGAKIVGEYSYGKGTVQELMDLSSGAQYKITTKKWLTPKGNWINDVGVKPDYEVSLSEKYKKEPTKENDNQLNKALEILSK